MFSFVKKLLVRIFVGKKKEKKNSWQKKFDNGKRNSSFFADLFFPIRQLSYFCIWFSYGWKVYY